MPKYCFVKSCPCNALNLKKGTTFHQFPKKLTEEWLKAIDQPVDTYINHHYVCSEHFREEDFDTYGSRKRLKDGTIPTQNLPPVTHRVFKKVRLVNLKGSGEVLKINSYRKVEVTRTKSTEELKDCRKQSHNLCLVKSCDSTSMTPGVSLFRFPEDPEICLKWTNNVGCNYLMDMQPYRVCSKHFEPKYLLKTADRLLLETNAVPTVLLWHADMVRYDHSYARCVQSEDDEPESSELLESQEEMPPLEYVSLPTEDHSASESQPKQEKAEQVHMDSEIITKKHNCEKCNASFRFRHALLQHYLIHDDDAAHMCNTCYQPFMTRTDLVLHERAHSLIKPHKCPICQKRFFQRNHLSSHLRSHPDYKPYECGVCNTRFTNESAIETHMKTHEDSLEVDPLRIEPSECKVEIKVEPEWDEEGLGERESLVLELESALANEASSLERGASGEYGFGGKVKIEVKEEWIKMELEEDDGV